MYKVQEETTAIRVHVCDIVTKKGLKESRAKWPRGCHDKSKWEMSAHNDLEDDGPR